MNRVLGNRLGIPVFLAAPNDPARSSPILLLIGEPSRARVQSRSCPTCAIETIFRPTEVDQVECRDSTVMPSCLFNMRIRRNWSHSGSPARSARPLQRRELRPGLRGTLSAARVETPARGGLGCAIDPRRDVRLARPNKTGVRTCIHVGPGETVLFARRITIPARVVSRLRRTGNYCWCY